MTVCQGMEKMLTLYCKLYNTKKASTVPVTFGKFFFFFNTNKQFSMFSI